MRSADDMMMTHPACDPESGAAVLARLGRELSRTLADTFEAPLPNSFHALIARIDREDERPAAPSFDERR